MKTLVTLICALFVANTFAYTWISDASGSCKKLAKAEIESLLEYEREQQNGSQINYIVRGPEAKVELTNDPHALVSVKVSLLTYTLDDDGFEINEKYTFNAKYNRDTKSCFLGSEPEYEGDYCGEVNEKKCLK